MEKLNATKNRKGMLKLRGVLFPRATEGYFKKDFTVLCGDNERWNIDSSDPHWKRKLKLLAWENVSLGGYFNWDTRKLELVYITKDTKRQIPEEEEDIPDVYYDDGSDKDYVYHELTTWGYLSPAA